MRFDDIAGLRALISEDYGPWGAARSISQKDIDLFAELTGDHQWIHVDAARAQAESPFGTTIAHGFLVLSLIPALRKAQGFAIVGQGSGLNYGIEALRFIRPVPVGSALQCRTRLEGVEEKKGGTMLDLGVAIHVVGQDVPSITFLWKLLYLP